MKDKIQLIFLVCLSSIVSLIYVYVKLQCKVT